MPTARTTPEQCPIYQAFRQGQSCRLDGDVLWRADGASFHAEYSSYPIFDRDRITGAVVTFVDISERKRAEELLRRAHEELEQRVAERTRELTEALAEIARTNERLRRLSAHLQSVREDERTRIAREIHDELGSVLVALKLDVGWLKMRLDGKPELMAKAGTMANLLDSAVTEVGRIITDLRPSILDHQGLWAAMEWHAQGVSAGDRPARPAGDERHPGCTGAGRRVGHRRVPHLPGNSEQYRAPRECHRG